MPAGTQVAADWVAVLRDGAVSGDDDDRFGPRRLREMEAVQGVVLVAGTRWECLGRRVARTRLHKVLVEVRFVELYPARMAGCMESPDASRPRSGSKTSGITSAHDVATWRHRERTREAFHSAARADAKGAVNQALACVHALSALAGMCQELPGVFEEHGCVGCSCCIQRLPACGRTWFRVRRGSRL